MTLSLFLAFSGLAAAQQGQSPAAGADAVSVQITPRIAVDADSVPWSTGPASMPGVRMAILEGDPAAQGIFTLRLELPAGFRLEPHTHPQPERVTVLSGSVYVAFGSVFDAGAAGAKRFAAGSFYVNPPGEPHFVWTSEPAVVQLTGHGPWRVDRSSGPASLSHPPR